MELLILDLISQTPTDPVIVEILKRGAFEKARQNYAQLAAQPSVACSSCIFQEFRKEKFKQTLIDNKQMELLILDLLTTTPTDPVIVEILKREYLIDFDQNRFEFIGPRDPPGLCVVYSQSECDGPNCFVETSIMDCIDRIKCLREIYKIEIENTIQF